MSERLTQGDIVELINAAMHLADNMEEKEVLFSMVTYFQTQGPNTLNNVKRLYNRLPHASKVKIQRFYDILQNFLEEMS